MKTRLLVFLCTALVSVAPAREPRVQLRAPEAALPEPEPTAEEIRQTVLHLQQLAQEAQEENNRLVTALNTATAAIVQGQGEVDGVRQELASLRAWGVEQQVRAEHAEAEVSLQTRLAWKWRLISFGIVALIATFFVARQYLPFLKLL